MQSAMLNKYRGNREGGREYSYNRVNLKPSHLPQVWKGEAAVGKEWLTRGAIEREEAAEGLL